MTRRAAHPNQLGFTFEAPQPASAPAELAGLERQVSRAVAAMLKDDPRAREVIAAEDPFDPASYDALLRINVKIAKASFPQVFAADAPPVKYDDWDDEDDDW